MTSENSITGRNGRKVVGSTLVAKTTRWSVNPTLATSNEWGDSDSSGYTNRSAGRKDATFDSEGKYSTTSEVFDLFAPEDIAQVTLWMNTTSLYWDFPRALCNDFSLELDIDGETVVGWTSGWGADGIFYRPGQADAPSRTLPS